MICSALATETAAWKVTPGRTYFRCRDGADDELQVREVGSGAPKREAREMLEAARRREIGPWCWYGDWTVGVDPSRTYRHAAGTEASRREQLFIRVKWADDDLGGTQAPSLRIVPENSRFSGNQSRFWQPVTFLATSHANSGEAETPDPVGTAGSFSP